jgi:hypothetical protein
MVRKKNKKKKGKPFKRKLVTTVGDLIERSMQKGLTESQAWASLMSGITQGGKGEELAERATKFLAQFDAQTTAQFDTEIARLHGVTSPARFRKQTLALLANVYDVGYARGLAKHGDADDPQS